VKSYFPRIVPAVSRIQPLQGGAMKVLLDGSKMDLKLDEKKTVDDLISKVKQVTGGRSRIINGITVDDVPLSGGNEEKLLKKKLGVVKKIEFVTDSPMELAVRTLDRADKYLGSFKSHLDKLVVSLSSGTEEEDYDMFIEGLKGWETVFRLLDIVRDMLSLDFTKIIVKGKSVDKMNIDLQKMLNDVKKALNSSDTVYFKDLIQYELIPNVEYMKVVVNEIMKMVKKEMAS
jgi:hypothetical protein